MLPQSLRRDSAVYYFRKLSELFHFMTVRVDTKEHIGLFCAKLYTAYAESPAGDSARIKIIYHQQRGIEIAVHCS